MLLLSNCHNFIAVNQSKILLDIYSETNKVKSFRKFIQPIPDKSSTYLQILITERGYYVQKQLVNLRNLI